MALTRFEVAKACVLKAASEARLVTETLAIEQADGRILAEDILAPFDVPGFDHAAMDGYAIAESPATLPAELSLKVVGRVMAGDHPFRSIHAGEAVQIATGAILPKGACRVVPVESSECLVGDLVRLRLSADSAINIRGATDDYCMGQLALAAGSRVNFAALGVMASFGMQHLRVACVPKVSVLVTGSELVPAGNARAPGRIHDSNGAVLRGLLRAEGVIAQPIGPLPDQFDCLRQALQDASTAADVVITTGGASAGQADFIPRLLAELGEVLVWKVAMRPGMPLLFARVGCTLVFGLPGNPVAVVAGFLALVRPALRVMQGAALPATMHARLLQSLNKSHDRLEFRRAELSTDAQGIARVNAHPALSSGVLRSVVETNALILLDADRRQWQADEVVEVLCY
jgi:molybdopterin molybdotransferase